MAAADGGGGNVRVAVLGTGIMGSAMARRLVAAGLRTTVWDRSPSATAPLASAGAVVAASPAEAVRDAAVVITMLPTAEVVNSVIVGGGVAEAFAEGAVWAQMGTIGVAATIEPPDRLGQLRPDVMFVDAPVSGSKGPAEAGELLILASGPAAADRVVRPAFSAIGRKTVWLGEAGQGSRMKLVVNAYMSILIEGVAEAIELAGRMGIDTAELAEAIEGGPLDAPIADAKLHKIERATSRPSSRWSGRSRTWIWRSRQPTATPCRCWPRCPGSGAQPLTPVTAAKTSAPRAWPWAATSNSSHPSSDGTAITMTRRNRPVRKVHIRARPPQMVTTEAAPNRYRPHGQARNASYPRSAPSGQITRTGVPRSRAYATTSAVPPYPRAGLPSHTAYNSSASSTISLLAAICASEVESPNGSRWTETACANRRSYCPCASCGSSSRYRSAGTMTSILPPRSVTARANT